MKAALAADPTAVPVSDVRDCLNSDSTLLNNYNAKVAVELFRNNQFSFLFNAAEKVRNARDGSDLRPARDDVPPAGRDAGGPRVELVEDGDAEDLQVERPATSSATG